MMEDVKESKSLDFIDKTELMFKFDIIKQEKEYINKGYIISHSLKKVNVKSMDELDKDLLGFDPNAIFDPIDNEMNRMGS